MNAHLHLLADFEDMVKVWAPIIFFVVYGIAQLVSSVQEEKRKAARKRPPAPAANLPRQAAAPPAPGGEGKPLTLEETLRREVDEFLRRAQGAPPAPAQRAQPPRTKPAETKPRRPSTPSPGRPEAKPEPAAGEARRPSLARPSLAGQVPQDLQGPAAVALHVGTLGAEVALADERMEQHLREKFTHQVGTFVHAEHGDAKPAAGSPLAQELRKMLSNPAGVRQIIVASEILQRPTHRWE